jgi:uncharacterized protein (TIGR03382 family)
MLYALIISAAMAAPASIDSLTVDASGKVVGSSAVEPSLAFAGANAVGSGGGDGSGDGTGDDGTGDDGTGDDGATDDAADTGSSDDKGGCSAIGGAPAAVGVLFGFAAALRRRRQS